MKWDRITILTSGVGGGFNQNVAIHSIYPQNSNSSHHPKRRKSLTKWTLIFKASSPSCSSSAGAAGGAAAPSRVLWRRITTVFSSQNDPKEFKKPKWANIGVHEWRASSSPPLQGRKGVDGWGGSERGDHVTDGVATGRPGVIINVTCSKFDSQRRRRRRWTLGELHSAAVSTKPVASSKHFCR